jgi:hypothetical protein
MRLASSSPAQSVNEAQLKHRYTLSQTPSQAAFIERFNQTLRQKLRLAVQSELGSISQSRAADERIKMTNPKAWRALIARAVEANNEEMAAGTGMSPNEYMERFVRDGKQAVARQVDGDDTERTAKAERELERQKELTVGTRVRLVNTATQKAELRGARKMQARFSQVIDYTNKILKLDGRLPHEVMPFTGRRYCIIWYKVFDRDMKKPAPVFEPARIVYE